MVRSEGEDRAVLLARIAHGQATPLSALIPDYLQEKGMKPRQSLDYRRAILKLEAWLSARPLSPTIAAVTKRIASDYRLEVFIRQGVHPRTANKDISAISGLWKWAERRGLVEDNPWRGQMLPEPKAGRRGAQGSDKRPYTDAEVATLVSAPDISVTLQDAITILALSGMRIEEMARMTVGDVRDLGGPIPYIQLRGTKTDAAKRAVPVHPGLVAIVTRRIEGKAAGHYLFHELPTPSTDSAMERGQPITKAFTRLRRRIGGTLDQREDGARQANTDLHSLRRFFIRSAWDALDRGAQGFSRWTVAQVVGHSTEDIGAWHDKQVCGGRLDRPRRFV